MIRIPRRYLGASGASGPLLYLRRTHGVALGELVRVEAPGVAPAYGQVIEAGEEVTVVQILGDSVGIAPHSLEVIFAGESAVAPVGRELLGRVLSGTGEPRDGLPPPVGESVRPVWGRPINPTRRAPPADFLETGISAVDGLATLVRGQKLPIFAGPGMPALEIAADLVEWVRAPREEPFALVFAGIGITARDTQMFLDRFGTSEIAERSVFYLNQCGDPVVERLLTPRFALTAAEYFAFELGMHVLVVSLDFTQYCEALREIAAAREEVPGRRGYPGYMYTDLASLFERAGVLSGQRGSLTQLPILTMPDDDITHPIPDLVGYITEGQIVLSRELHRRGVYPPIDPLPSLSRLMNSGIGPDRTVPEHRRWADQLYSLYAQGREARLMAAIVGERGLPESYRRALRFADGFEMYFLNQGHNRRSLTETIESGWQLLEQLPREDLSRIDARTWQLRAAATAQRGTRSSS